MDHFFAQRQVQQLAISSVQHVIAEMLESPVLRKLCGTSNDPNLPEVKLVPRLSSPTAVADYSPVEDVARLSISRVVGNPMQQTEPCDPQEIKGALIHEFTHREQKRFGGEFERAMLHQGVVEEIAHSTILFELGAFIKNAWYAEEMRRQGDTKLSNYYASSQSQQVDVQVAQLYQQLVGQDPSSHTTGEAAHKMALTLLFGSGGAFTNIYINNVLAQRLGFLEALEGAVASVAQRSGKLSFDGDTQNVLNPIKINMGQFDKVGELPNGANFLVDPETRSASWTTKPDFLNQFLTDGHKAQIHKINTLTTQLQTSPTVDRNLAVNSRPAPAALVHG